MKKWEYKRVSERDLDLFKSGKQGWELITMVLGYYIFKREFMEDTDNDLIPMD